MSQPMNHADNFWLCMDDPTNLMVITGFMQFNGEVDFDRFVNTIECRLLVHER